MPYIGNDIVDLRQPANVNSSRDSRFLKKVLTAAEAEFVQNADDPAAALWSFWAAKEAAYKVIKKIDNYACFLPRRWEVFLRPAARHYFDGEVALSGESKIFVRLFLQEEFLHCLAVSEEGARDKIICAQAFLPERENVSEENASLFLRDFAARQISSCLRVLPADIEIERKIINGEPGPPRLLVGGAASLGDISLSHDGRFVAFAFLP